MEQMCWARKMEFVASARRLDVDKIFVANDGRGLDNAEACTSHNQFIDHVEQTIKNFERQFPGASHHLVSGNLDLLLKGSATITNPTHQACWDAAMKLRSKISDF